VSSLDPLALPLRGTVLVEASAGTGKTFTLCNLYLRLLVESERGVGQILVVTYTNAATAELRSRIRERLRIALLALRNGPDENADEFMAAFATRRRELGRAAGDARLLEVALRSFDEAAIFTIHGFCQRMLLENAFESVSTFDAELVADQRPLCRELVEDHWVRALHDAPAMLVDCIAGKQAAKSLDRLQDLVAKSIAHPDVPVLPERPLDPPYPELEQALRERRAALAAAGRIWAECRTELLAYLTREDIFHKSKYPAADVRTEWAPALDELFAKVDADPKLYDKVRKLTTAAICAGVKGKHTPLPHAFFDACQALCEAEEELQRRLEDCALCFRLSLVHWARTEARRRHEAANAQSFDDLLHRLRDALHGPAGDDLARRLRERFPAALVDEFQDTDPVQYAILRSIYREGPGPLLLIGDPKQAIYAFRGADVFAYLRARDDAGNAPQTLETNHRSDPGLVLALNTLFERAAAPFLLEGIPYLSMRSAQETARLTRPGGGAVDPLQVVFVPRTDGAKPITKERASDLVPRLVAAEIARLLDAKLEIGGERLRPGDVAVLCRTNLQAALVQKALRALSIPSVRQGDDSVFDADEASELEQVLRAVAEPGDASRLRCALVTGVIGLDAAALRALGSDEDGWDVWAARFRSWHDTWVGRGFMAAFRRLLDDCRVVPRLLAEEGGERAATNLLHLAELLQGESMRSHRGPLALVDWLALMRSDPEARQQGSEAAEVRLESDAHAVQLTTVHRSKGLEYGVVYCPFLWDGTLLSENDKSWIRFHRDDAERTLCFDVGAAKDPEHTARIELSEREALAESLRLLYVALTRARHLCTIVWGNFNKGDTSPLAYLLHQTGARENAATDDLAAFVQQRFAKLSDEAIRADLRALADASGGRIAVRDVSADDPPPYRPDETAPSALAAREASRELSQSWRMSSFSALVASRDRLGQRAEEGVDHDAQEVADDGEGAAPIVGGTAVPRSPRILLDEFPGGARAGQLVHDVFEHLDFGADDATIAAVIEKRSRRHRLPKASLAPLGTAIRDVLDAPLLAAPGAALRLASVESARILREMPFTMPVAQTRARALDAAALAEAFETLGSPAARAYAPVLRRIGFPELRGYLTGFIDLVFEHEGRWWVVDYKSNHMGGHAEDYAPPALAAEMARHHYVLQYHLYAVAVHLYLMQRIAGYDYDRDVGGVLYLFVRGISPRHPPGTGVFRDRPSRALIERLSEVLGGTAP
jgi:exodeoxyribonuclease V beta subunit